MQRHIPERLILKSHFIELRKIYIHFDAIEGVCLNLVQRHSRASFRERESVFAILAESACSPRWCARSWCINNAKARKAVSSRERPDLTQRRMCPNSLPVCENSGLQPLAACAHRPTLGVRAAPAMPMKLAKTRKQTKLKFCDLTSLSLTFLRSTRNNQSKVSCPAVCQPLYLAALLLSC